MDKKYLIPIKNGFLIYQPESDIIYRGKRKTAELKDILIIPFLNAVLKPVLEYIANFAWPFLDLLEYRMIKYTILMITSGVVYYKFIYQKNKEKLLQSQLETVKLIDIQQQLLKYHVKLLILVIIFLVFLFCSSLYLLVYGTEAEEYFIATVCYTVGIPMLTVEIGIKDRFVLIKHLLKLNKEE